jgi:hypothetical protein
MENRPLEIIARSQDIALHSRVLDYRPGMWEELAWPKGISASAASRA